MAWLYSLWVIVTFVGVFLLLLPAYYVFLSNPKWNRISHKLTKIWGRALFFLAGVRAIKVWEFDPDPSETYIFCPNHFSYADIPLMAVTLPGYWKFVGKRSLEKIPVFGYMYRRLYILVERNSRLDSYRALHACLDALDEKISLVIFPEGGIFTNDPPSMTRLKDGPFRMAIEKGVSIVPVSIPFNWIFLWDTKINPKGLPLKITFHKPIDTKGLTLEDLDLVKEKTRSIIQESLDLEFKNENRQRDRQQARTPGKVEVQ